MSTFDRQPTGSTLRRLAVAAAITFVPAASAQPSASPLRIREAQPADAAAAVLTLDHDAAAALRGRSRVMLEGFPLGLGVAADLDLRPVEVFTPDAVIVERTASGDRPLPRPEVTILAGTLAGDPGSRAFLALAPGMVNGFIQTTDAAYFISSGPSGTLDPVVYRADALKPGDLTLHTPVCNADELDQYQRRLHAVYARPSSDRNLTLPDIAPRNVDLALDCDYEYAQRFSLNTANASAYAATLLGAVSSIYRGEFNTRLRISFLRIWTTPEDPWTQPDARDQLAQFRAYWQINEQVVPRHAAHLLSTRQLTSAGGTAYLAGLCSAEGYGLSAYLNGFFPMPLRDNQPQNWDVYVVAHELGHNFNAPHTHQMTPTIDACGLGTCTGAAQNGTIMSYCHICPGGLSNIRLTMHPRMVQERIVPFLESIACDLIARGACVADINRDSSVNIADLTLLLEGFNSQVPTAFTRGDMNGDRTINGADLSVLLRSYGETCQ